MADSLDCSYRSELLCRIFYTDYLEQAEEGRKNADLVNVAGGRDAKKVNKLKSYVVSVPFVTKGFDSSKP